MTIQEIQDILEKKLRPERYLHTIGVMYTAASLAMAYGSDVETAMLAGLLHDCAKCISSDEKIRLCQKYKLPITSVEYNNPELLHAKAGMVLAREEYGIEDPAVLHAIEVHTTGAPGMSLLDMIINVADYIEPGRDKAPRLAYIRRTAFCDIELCVAEIMKDTLAYLASRGAENSIDPQTRATYDYYKHKIDNSQKE